MPREHCKYHFEVVGVAGKLGRVYDECGILVAADMQPVGLWVWTLPSRRYLGSYGVTCKPAPSSQLGRLPIASLVLRLVGRYGSADELPRRDHLESRIQGRTTSGPCSDRRRKDHWQLGCQLWRSDHWRMAHAGAPNRARRQLYIWVEQDD